MNTLYLIIHRPWMGRRLHSFALYEDIMLWLIFKDNLSDPTGFPIIVARLLKYL